VYAVPDLSVVCLCYRAEERLSDVAAPLWEQLEASGVAYELILVANYWPGRADATPEEARAFAAAHTGVEVIAEPKGGDMGWDFRSGLEAASGDYLVVIDGDGQVPVRYALEIYRRLVETAADVAKGRRFIREDGSVRTATSIGFNLLFRLLFRTHGLWDVNGRPKGLTRFAYEQLDLRTNDWFTDAEILLKARVLGLEVVELPVRFLSHPAEASTVGLGTVWEFVVNMARWRLGRHPAQRPTAARTRTETLARTP
jgi:glycosyltransferase involved in cell wall biosynthesis